MSIPTSFEYLICIDFEATCLDELKKIKKREIIEFGALLINIHTGAIESKFHKYVRPVNNPVLSEYCKNLTGINQMLIDRQRIFPVVYQKFSNWLVRIRNWKQLQFATPQKRSGSVANTTFCSWTNLDLGTFLKRDCNRLGLSRPDYLRAWIDARKIFQLYSNIECKFEEALAHMNIIHTGNAHSAIDNAKMLAKLMIQLNEMGARINVITNYHYHQT